MELANYFFLAALWILICVGLGLYIAGVGLNGKRQYNIGLKAILTGYILGGGMLLVILVTT